MAKVIGFYGTDGEYGCLSNFYPVLFMVDGHTFNWSEQYIMYQKALLFNDGYVADQILEASSPLVAKRLGRSVIPYDDKTWSENRHDLVVKGLYNKFQQNGRIRDVLLGTGDAILAECSSHDHLWGIGLYLGHPDVQDPKKWRGQNLQGQFLMKVREKIRKDLGK